MIFVDSGAWFASVVPSDPGHAAATHWLEVNNEPLITTDYVVDETLTLLRARGESTVHCNLARCSLATHLRLFISKTTETAKSPEAKRQLVQKVISFTNGEQATDPAARTVQRPRVFYRREAEPQPLVIARP
ncbi:MAG: DNA-binding protein [Pyrinomonadaceae bacterium]